MSAERLDDPAASRSGLWFAILVYNLLLAAALPAALAFLGYQWLVRRKGRESLLRRFGFSLPKEAFQAHRTPVFWVHAVSVGEVMAAAPLIKKLREVYPAAAIWVSTITETGQATARQKLAEADAVIYFPFDLPWTVRKFIRRIRPRVFILLETEIWPNLLFFMARQRIPSVLVNGRLSLRSFRGYKRLLPFFGRIFECISLFSVQTPRDKERLTALGVSPDKVVQTGNMKYDQVVGQLGVEAGDLRVTLKLSMAHRLILAGSTHEGEEEAVARAYTALAGDYPDVRLLLAPRHLERLDRIEDLLRRLGLKAVRKTKLDGTVFSELPPDTVILLDTLGELQRFYHTADLVFVGGSLVPIGGHNVLEPAVCATPVLFGPHMENFHEIAAALTEKGAALQVSDDRQLCRELGQLLSDAERCRVMGQRAREAVLAHQGVVEKNVALMQGVLEASDSRSADESF